MKWESQPDDLNSVRYLRHTAISGGQLAAQVLASKVRHNEARRWAAIRSILPRNANFADHRELAKPEGALIGRVRIAGSRSAD
jgi:hypothetical protein